MLSCCTFKAHSIKYITIKNIDFSSVTNESQRYGKFL